MSFHFLREGIQGRKIKLGRCKNMTKINVDHQHQKIMNDVSKQFKEILEESLQAIYIYLDDTHKICNQRFASLLGYESTEELLAIDKPFTDTFVTDESQETLVSAYMQAMEHKIGSYIEVSWKKKSGGSVKTNVIIVPISYNGELLAFHFITEI